MLQMASFLKHHNNLWFVEQLNYPATQLIEVITHLYEQNILSPEKKKTETHSLQSFCCCCSYSVGDPYAYL